MEVTKILNKTAAEAEKLMNQFYDSKDLGIEICEVLNATEEDSLVKAISEDLVYSLLDFNVLTFRVKASEIDNPWYFLRNVGLYMYGTPVSVEIPANSALEPTWNVLGVMDRRSAVFKFKYDKKQDIYSFCLVLPRNLSADIANLFTFLDIRRIESRFLGLVADAEIYK